MCDFERVRMWQKDQARHKDRGHTQILEGCRNRLRRDGARLRVSFLSASFQKVTDSSHPISPLRGPPVPEASLPETVVTPTQHEEVAIVPPSALLTREIKGLEEENQWEAAHASLGREHMRPEPLPPLISKPVLQFAPILTTATLQHLLAQKTHAAVILQGFSRIISSKRITANLRCFKAEDIESKKRHGAAIMIQRLFRGHFARQHVNKMKKRIVGPKRKKQKKTRAELEAAEMALRVAEHWTCEGRLDALREMTSTGKALIGETLQQALQQSDSERRAIDDAQTALYAKEAQMMRRELEIQREMIQDLLEQTAQQQQVTKVLNMQLLCVGVDISQWTQSALRLQKFYGFKRDRVNRKKEKQRWHRDIRLTEAVQLVQAWWRGTKTRKFLMKRSFEELRMHCAQSASKSRGTTGEPDHHVKNLRK